MKKLTLVITMMICISSFAQQPKTVQCAGKIKNGTRCNRMIDPKKPSRAVMDAGGVYYCYQHTKQANILQRQQPYVILQTEEGLKVGDTLYITWIGKDSIAVNGK